MIKRYCDGCGKAMDPNVSTHLTFKHSTWVGTGTSRMQVAIEVQVTRSVNGVWNDGDLCVDCIRETVAEGLVGATR